MKKAISFPLLLTLNCALMKFLPCSAFFGNAPNSGFATYFALVLPYFAPDFIDNNSDDMSYKADITVTTGVTEAFLSV